MTLLATIIGVILITTATFALNLPFGYYRGGTAKFSFMWFLYIHAPIPVIFVLRTLAGYSIKYVPIFIIGAILGQVIGRRYYMKQQPVIIQ